MRRAYGKWLQLETVAGKLMEMVSSRVLATQRAGKNGGP